MKVSIEEKAATRGYKDRVVLTVRTDGKTPLVVNADGQDLSSLGDVDSLQIVSRDGRVVTISQNSGSVLHTVQAVREDPVTLAILTKFKERKQLSRDELTLLQDRKLVVNLGSTRDELIEIGMDINNREKHSVFLLGRNPALITDDNLNKLKAWSKDHSDRSNTATYHFFAVGLLKGIEEYKKTKVVGEL